jgi:hypothetical protein
MIALAVKLGRGAVGLGSDIVMFGSFFMRCDRHGRLLEKRV